MPDYEARIGMDQQLGLLDAEDIHWTNRRGFNLSLRESARARHLIVQVVPPGIVELVIPRGTRAREVQRFVEENRVWIERAWESFSTGAQEPAVPAEIHLAACDRRLDVLRGEGVASSWRESKTGLRISTPDNTLRQVDRMLRKWLMATARRELKPRLAEEADRLELKPTAVQVRLQRTRWGSCSSQGTISLNACLLLVDPPLLRYLLVHELCHLRHLNHSRRYWRLVARFEPDFRMLDRRLAAAWAELPAWTFRLARGNGLRQL
jgi:predicted metal-dependent hydrolase